MHACSHEQRHKNQPKCLKIMTKNERFLNYHDYVIIVMRDSLPDHNKEFERLVGDLSEAVHNISDPVALATMLYSIAEEKKSSNLIVRDINGKFDNIVQKLNDILEELKKLNERKTGQVSGLPHPDELSDRDREIIEFIREKGRACAEEVQEKFQYSGRNGASARLSNLFKNNMLEKIFIGRKVYYKLKT